MSVSTQVAHIVSHLEGESIETCDVSLHDPEARGATVLQVSEVNVMYTHAI